MNKDEFHFTLSARTAKELVLPEFNLWGLWDAIPTIYPEKFFSSSRAIRSWLTSLPEDQPFLLSMIHDQEDKAVAVALFGLSTHKVSKIFPVNVMSLLRTGESALDQVWPEYVQPRCIPELRDVVPQWYQWIMVESGVDILHTEVVPLNWIKDFSANIPAKLGVHAENIEGGGVCDLRKTLDWGRSVRRKTSQTERYAEKELSGALVLHEVTKGQCVFALDKHHHWHVNKRDSSSTPSGFRNETFRQVLEHYSFENAGLRVFLAKSGNETVGMTVLLQEGEWAGFYLSSLMPVKSNHWHIGIWMHTKIAKALQEQGVRLYDFMAGDAPYKDSLSDYGRQYARGVWINKKSFYGRLVCKLTRRNESGNIIKQ